MKESNFPELEQLKVSLRNYLQKHWKLFFAEGFLFVMLGAFAVMIPHLLTIGITLVLGWLLLIGGIVQLLRAVSIIKMPGFSIWFSIGILQTVIGFFLVKEPTQGSLTLTMIVTIYFALEGIAKIVLALSMHPLAHWGSLLFTGITGMVLALVVWSGWPETGFWVLGLLVGVNMVFLGVALIRISWHYRTRS